MDAKCGEAAVRKATHRRLGQPHSRGPLLIAAARQVGSVANNTDRWCRATVRATYAEPLLPLATSSSVGASLGFTSFPGRRRSGARL
jgi:hypothetical protein